MKTTKKAGKIQKVSLRTRVLLLFIVTMLTSFISISVISGQIINRVTKTRIENAYDNSLSVLLGTIENIIDSMELLSQQIGFGINIAEDITELYSSEVDSYHKIELNQQIMDRLRQLTFANINIGLVFFEYGDEVAISNFNITRSLELDDRSYLCRANELWFYGPKRSLASYNSGMVLCLMRKIKQLTPEARDIYMGIETNYDTLDKLFRTEGEGTKGLVFINDRGEICHSSVPELCPEGALFQDIARADGMLGGYRYFKKDSEMGFSVVELVDMKLEKGAYLKEYYSVFGAIISFVGIVTFLFVVVWKNIYSPLRLFDRELDRLLEQENPDEGCVILTGMQEYDHLLRRIEEMRRQIQEMLKDMVSREEEKGRLEIEKLRYQINPHFLMNTLNTIHWMAVMNGQQDIDKAVQALNRLLFYNLDKDGYHTDIERELSAMGEYMLLQKVRLYDFTYTIRREPETAEFCYPIPKFILQPVIENSIVHGYRDDMHIEVVVRDRNDWVEIEISDDGLGISKEQLVRIHEYAENKNREMRRQPSHAIGIGLEYVIQSLEQFYLNVGKKGRFSIGNRESGGTVVRILVPKMHEEKKDAECVDC